LAAKVIHPPLISKKKNEEKLKDDEINRAITLFRQRFDSLFAKKILK